MSNIVRSAPDLNNISYQFDLDNMDQIYAYDSNNRLSTITIVFSGITFVQTFTRDVNGNVTEVSNWVPQ